MPTEVINPHLRLWDANFDSDLNSIIGDLQSMESGYFGITPTPSLVKNPTPKPLNPTETIKEGTINDIASVIGSNPTELNDFLNAVGGQESNWVPPQVQPQPVPIEIPETPQTSETLTELDKIKIAFYDGINNFFGGNIPTDLQERWEALNEWPKKFVNETVDSAYKQYSEEKEKHTDYDEIKLERDNWVNTFTGLKPNEVRTEYDKEKEKHSEADLKPADLPNNWKDYLTRPNIPITENDWNTDWSLRIKVGVDEKIVKTADWDNLSKRPTQDQLNQAVQDVKDSYLNVVPKADYDKVDAIVKDYEAKVPKIMELIKKHTNK